MQGRKALFSGVTNGVALPPLLNHHTTYNSHHGDHILLACQALKGFTTSICMTTRPTLRQQVANKKTSHTRKTTEHLSQHTKLIAIIQAVAAAPLTESGHDISTLPCKGVDLILWQCCKSVVDVAVACLISTHCQDQVTHRRVSWQAPVGLGDWRCGLVVPDVASIDVLGVVTSRAGQGTCQVTSWQQDCDRPLLSSRKLVH